MSEYVPEGMPSSQISNGSNNKKKSRKKKKKGGTRKLSYHTKTANPALGNNCHTTKVDNPRTRQDHFKSTTEAIT